MKRAPIARGLRRGGTPSRLRPHERPWCAGPPAARPIAGARGGRPLHALACTRRLRRVAKPFTQPKMPWHEPRGPPLRHFEREKDGSATRPPQCRDTGPRAAARPEPLAVVVGAPEPGRACEKPADTQPFGRAAPARSHRPRPPSSGRALNRRARTVARTGAVLSASSSRATRVDRPVPAPAAFSSRPRGHHQCEPLPLPPPLAPAGSPPRGRARARAPSPRRQEPTPPPPPVCVSRRDRRCSAEAGGRALSSAPERLSRSARRPPCRRAPARVANVWSR